MKSRNCQFKAEQKEDFFTHCIVINFETFFLQDIVANTTLQQSQKESSKLIEDNCSSAY